MNYKMIFYVLARMLKLLTGLLIIPMLVSLMYNESSKTTVSFLVAIIISLALYSIINAFTEENREQDFYKREGFVIVTLTWIVFSLIGALPFYLSGEIPSYIDSLFETVSGFTTTGSTILQDI